MSELELARAKRHVTFLERTIAEQEEIIARLEALGDAEGAARGRELMAAYCCSLGLARDHVQRLQSK